MGRKTQLSYIIPYQIDKLSKYLVVGFRFVPHTSVNLAIRQFR